MESSRDEKIKKVRFLETMLFMIRNYQYNPTEEMWGKIENLTDELYKEILNKQEDKEKNIGKEPGE